MRLFWCERCQRYARRALAHLEFRAAIDVGDVGPDSAWWYDEIDFTGESLVSLVDGQEFTCCYCQTEPVQVKTMAREDCPHQWVQSGDWRRCRLCGQTQRGRVIFDEGADG